MNSRSAVLRLLLMVLGFYFLVSGLAGAQMPGGSDEQKLTAGMSGKLVKKDLTQHPMPHWAPLYRTGRSIYSDFEMLILSYATDADKAAALIPDTVTLIDIPAMPGQAAVNITFAKYRDVDSLGPYMEMIIGIPVLYKDQMYIYVPAIYVDNDAGMVAGREAGGYPKKFAEIEMRNYGNLFLAHISRAPKEMKTASPKFYDLASASVNRGGKLVSVPLAPDVKPLPFPYNMLIPLPTATGKPQNYVLPTMGMRYIPAVGPKAKKNPAEVLQLIGTPWVVTKGEIYEGLDASMELYLQKEDPIAQKLPFNSILGSYIVKGSMYTDSNEWSVLHDYNIKK